MNKKICVVIPSRNETLLIRTINQVFVSAEFPDDIEIRVVLDGWDLTPNGKITQEMVDLFIHQVSLLHEMALRDIRIKIMQVSGEAKGVRHALNWALAETDATYFIKLDAHCDFSRGWDSELIRSYEQEGRETLIIPRIQSMDPDTFKYGGRFFDYLYINSDIHQCHWPEYATDRKHENLCVK